MVERLVPGTTFAGRYYEPHRQRYVFAAGYAQGQRVLDAACGAGYGCDLLAAAGAREVVGVDISEEAVRLAAASVRRPNVRFMSMDCETLDEIDGSFDVVVCLEAIHCIREPDRFLAAVGNVMSADARLIVSCPNANRYARNPDWPHSNPHALHDFDPGELTRLLETQFAVESLWRQDESDAYVRWRKLVKALGRMHAELSRSRWLRLENSVRRLFRSPEIQVPDFAGFDQCCEGDYVLEPFAPELSDPEPNTVIAVCQEPADTPGGEGSVGEISP